MIRFLSKKKEENNETVKYNFFFFSQTKYEAWGTARISFACQQQINQKAEKQMNNKYIKRLAIFVTRFFYKNTLYKNVHDESFSFFFMNIFSNASKTFSSWFSWPILFYLFKIFSFTHTHKKVFCFLHYSMILRP